MFFLLKPSVLPLRVPDNSSIKSKKVSRSAVDDASKQLWD